MVELPAAGVRVASASPELFLSRQGRRVRSSPIKGTTAPGTPFTDKDRAENVMIVDLVRNDLGRVCVPGTVRVPALLAEEDHPGLTHLVSTVEGELRPGLGWAELLDATFPAGLGHRRPEAGGARAHRPARAGRARGSTAARSAGSTPTGPRAS